MAERKFVGLEGLQQYDAAIKEVIDTKANAADLTSHTGNTSNPHGVALSQLGVTATAAELNCVDGVRSNIQTQLDGKLGDYTILIYNGTSGNPKPVRFVTVDYSTCNSENGVAIKISMVSGHGNGTSYAFLQDAIIKVSFQGAVEVDNFKYYGASAGTYDSAARQYGDIFWVIDTTNKIVYFYVLMGQYARVYQTPWKRLTYSTGGTITQHTNGTIYSSGDKVWANNSEFALMSDTSALETKTDASAKLASAKEYTDTIIAAAMEENDAVIATLDEAIGTKVPTSRTVNGKSLTSNITLSASDVGADASGSADIVQTNLDTHTSNSDIHLTTNEKNKLSGIAAGAEVNQNAFSNVIVGSTTIVADSKTDSLTIAAGIGITVTGDATNDKVTITNSGVRGISTGSTDGTISVNTNGTSANVKVKGLGSAAYTASTAYDASGTAQTKANAALASAKTYTDTAISNLINSAPTTLDTLGEIAAAMAEHDDVVEALEDAIGSKANASDLTSHTGNKSNPHGVTAAQIGALPVTGGTIPGNILIQNSNPHLGLVDTSGAVAYFQTHDDGSGLKAGFGYGWVNSLKIDGSGNMYLTGNVSAPGNLTAGGIITEGGAALSNKYAPLSHTHNYAGSSSAGGAATSANKLNTNAGDSNTPVYFANGKPVACTSLDLSTTGNAATATKASTIDMKKGQFSGTNKKYPILLASNTVGGNISNDESGFTYTEMPLLAGELYMDGAGALHANSFAGTASFASRIDTAGVGTTGKPIYLTTSGEFAECSALLARITALENRICIKAGTQITLADGTTKNIEDVKYGDTLLGYDVLSDKFINVKSYGIVPTGKAHIWELFAFEDGRTVEIYDTHQLYSKTNGRMLESNKWKCGDYGIGVEGEPIQLALVDKVGDAHEDYKYQIYTENGTCFANGILLGHDPWCCYRQYSNCHEDNPWLEDLTKEEVAYFKSLADIYENERRSHLNTREYVKKAAPYFAKINIANQEIEDRKAQLSGQDYKTIKHSQGVLSEEDFALTVADCETLRAEIAEYEAIVEENEAIVTELKNEYTLTEWDRKKIFENAFAAAMEHVRNNGLN